MDFINNWTKKLYVKNLSKKFEATKKKLAKYDDADCHSSPEDGCQHCVDLWKDKSVEQELNYHRQK